MRRSIYKSPDELQAMLPAGELTGAALDAVEAAIRPGITTLELDAIAERVIRDGGGEPNFALVPGYSHTICASVNDAVVHGIPNSTPLQAGDLVSVDCGALLDGWNGDSARTFLVAGGAVDGALEDDAASAGASASDSDSASASDIASDIADGTAAAGDLATAQRVSDACRAAMWAGVASLAKRRHLGEVGGDIEAAVEREGTFGILDDYTGHGIGRSMHEDPTLFNYATRRRGPVIKPGLAICVEPMITAGRKEVTVDDDGWTVRTVDGSLAAHWEHTVLVHATGIWVSTARDGGAAGLAAHGVTPIRPGGSSAVTGASDARSL